MDFFKRFVYVMVFFIYGSYSLSNNNSISEFLNSDSKNWTIYNKKIHKSLVKTFTNQCGQYPSEKCFRHILRFSFKNRLDCNEDVPMLFIKNLPKWNLLINIFPKRPLFTDSMSLFYLAFSAMTSKIMNSTCLEKIPMQLLHQHVFNVSLSQEKIINFFHNISTIANRTSSKLPSNIFFQYTNLLYYVFFGQFVCSDSDDIPESKILTLKKQFMEFDLNIIENLLSNWSNIYLLIDRADYLPKYFLPTSNSKGISITQKNIIESSGDESTPLIDFTDTSLTSIPYSKINLDSSSSYTTDETSKFNTEDASGMEDDLTEFIPVTAYTEK